MNAQMPSPDFYWAKAFSMNYSKIYLDLCDRAIHRILPQDVYKEKHHIHPRCMGGTDDKDNLIFLTAEEHYLAHQLLVRMFPDQPKLIYAAKLMSADSSGGRTNNKSFGWIRRRFAEEISKTNKGKQAWNSGRKTKPHSDETKAKMAASAAGKCPWNKGRPMSEEQKEKISISVKRYRAELTYEAPIQEATQRI